MVAMMASQMSFNPRPRVRGDGVSFGKGGIGIQFQSTPPREGRPPAGRLAVVEVVVSIHAPA